METANPNSLLVTYFLVQRAKYKYLYPNYHILYIKYKVVFFLKSFNLWRLLLMITLYHQTKTPINFWYRWRIES